MPDVDDKLIEAISKMPVGTSFDEKLLLYIIADVDGASSLRKLRTNPGIYGVRTLPCPITGSYRYTRKDN